MVTLYGKYQGALQCEVLHEASGQRLVTQAPLDNHGRGNGFSPTDLLAASLMSCAATIMGLYAQQRGIVLTGMTMEVKKTMTPAGWGLRRVESLDLLFRMPPGISDASVRAGLQKAVEDCPVKKSLSAEVRIGVAMEWSEAMDPTE